MKIEMKGIHKAFGSNKVLEGVDFDLKQGEIHALMGENGAGKSTLMNILTSIHKKDAGTITVDGEEKEFLNAKDAEDNGITFIHQELNIWPNLTILENLFLDKEIKNKFGFIDRKAMEKIAREKCNEVGIDLPLKRVAGSCSVGQQQMTEIIRALMTDAKVLIMDEPTAALTERETEKLFEVMKKLRESNTAIVYISHRMEEVFAMCDRITVMRDGISVSTRPISETNYDTVVKEMVGRELGSYYPDRTTVPEGTFLEVRGLTHKPFFEDVSFELKKGEILGVAGLMGAGRTEIMRSIFGIDKKDSGKIFMEDRELHIDKPGDAIKDGLGIITEDRKDEGVILDFSIHDNISLPSIDSFAPKTFIRAKEEKDFTMMMAERLRVKMASINNPVSSLSGGNQQKVVIAKWVGVGPKVMIMDEPTRGIDVGAKREIYELMNELTERGVSIIMVSSDLPEVLGMSDRIMVIHEGRVSGIINKKDATQELVMRYATGGK